MTWQAPSIYLQQLRQRGQAELSEAVRGTKWKERARVLVKTHMTMLFIWLSSRRCWHLEVLHPVASLFVLSPPSFHHNTCQRDRRRGLKHLISYTRYDGLRLFCERPSCDVIVTVALWGCLYCQLWCGGKANALLWCLLLWRMPATELGLERKPCLCHILYIKTMSTTRDPRRTLFRRRWSWVLIRETGIQGLTSLGSREMKSRWNCGSITCIICLTCVGSQLSINSSSASSFSGPVQLCNTEELGLTKRSHPR